MLAFYNDKCHCLFSDTLPDGRHLAVSMASHPHSNRSLYGPIPPIHTPNDTVSLCDISGRLFTAHWAPEHSKSTGADDQYFTVIKLDKDSVATIVTQDGTICQI